MATHIAKLGFGKKVKKKAFQALVVPPASRGSVISRMLAVMEKDGGPISGTNCKISSFGKDFSCADKD